MCYVIARAVSYLKRKQGVIEAISTTGNLENFDESKLSFLISVYPPHKGFILLTGRHREHSLPCKRGRGMGNKTQEYIAHRCWRQDSDILFLQQKGIIPTFL